MSNMHPTYAVARLGSTFASRCESGWLSPGFSATGSWSPIRRRCLIPALSFFTAGTVEKVAAITLTLAQSGRRTSNQPTWQQEPP